MCSPHSLLGSHARLSSRSFSTPPSSESTVLASESELVDSTCSQCWVVVWRRPLICSALGGVMVRKSMPNLSMRSSRRAGLSRLPAYLRALARASTSSDVVSPSPNTTSLEAKAATSPQARLRMAWFDILATTVRFPGNMSPCGSRIRRLGKPWVNWALMSLQGGAWRNMTLPKRSRRRSAILASNSTLPVCSRPWRDLPDWWNSSGLLRRFRNSLLRSSPDRPDDARDCSRWATKRLQYSVHSWTLEKWTGSLESSGNKPRGNRRTSNKNRSKLKCVGCSGDTASPKGKYGDSPADCSSYSDEWLVPAVASGMAWTWGSSASPGGSG